MARWPHTRREPHVGRPSSRRPATRAHSRWSSPTSRSLNPSKTSDLTVAFRDRAPGMPCAHPTIEHFAPLFVALGAGATPDAAPEQVIDGFWMGLAKRSLQVA